MSYISNFEPAYVCIYVNASDIKEFVKNKIIEWTNKDLGISLDFDSINGNIEFILSFDKKELTESDIEILFRKSIDPDDPLHTSRTIQELFMNEINGYEILPMYGHDEEGKYCLINIPYDYYMDSVNENP